MVRNAQTERDEAFMREALALAQCGEGFVDPNPLVGAVIVRDGEIIARGFHEHYGEEHAERNALNDAQRRNIDVRGATLYVTLEPCSHYGKQPPCAEAVAASGITRVVVGSDDPNPKVNGQGFRLLEAAGIEVTTHVLRAACDEVNEAFFHFIRTGTPWVTLKYAMSLDGKIALENGRQWTISGAESHERVHTERARVSAIITGTGTVLSDDPQLTARPTRPANPARGAHQPLRVIMDSRLRTPLEARIVTQSATDGLTLLATSEESMARVASEASVVGEATVSRSSGVNDPAGYQHGFAGYHSPADYSARGCSVVAFPTASNGGVSIPAVLEYLGTHGIDSVLLECGGRLASAFLEAGAVNRVEAFIAPVIAGSAAAPGPVGGSGPLNPMPRLKDLRVSRCGDDTLIEGIVASDFAEKNPTDPTEGNE